MIDLPDLPEGSAIGVLRGRHGVRLRWPRPGRLSGLIFASLGILTVLLLAGVFLAALGGRKDSFPWLVLPALVFGAAFNLWYWLGRSGRSTLALDPGRLVFYAPARPGMSQAMMRMSQLRAKGYPADDMQGRAEWETAVEAQRRRGRREIPRSPELLVVDLGNLRGVSVGADLSAIRFGQDLGRADREWLVEVVKRWKDSAA